MIEHYKFMNKNVLNKNNSDTIQDPRWETFKRDSKRRAIALSGCTILVLAIAIILGHFWLFPVAMGILWLVVMSWKFWSKGN